ncbi:MAG TPA: carboxypeptidase-like regulatory domain-containing protein, partial [Terriglobia bacterium]|nr:carboxypeptidase-like regulatory domain-containing protein [Terriglobia bacterium]
MSVYRTIMLALLALAPVPQQAAPQDSLASIHGVVVDAATGEPVVGAAVELTGIQRNNVLSVYDITDKNGRFAIPDVQPGSDYQLTATDPGEYLAGAYGQPNPHERWKPLTVNAGQKLEVRLILTPVGKITGKVVDANNRPLRRATVTVLRATYDSNTDQRGVR